MGKKVLNPVQRKKNMMHDAFKSNNLKVCKLLNIAFKGCLQYIASDTIYQNCRLNQTRG